MIAVSITKSFGAFALDVSFETPLGITALFGRSGAGKTTVAHAIAGLTIPDRGKITVNGRTLFDSDRRLSLPVSKRKVGYVFQDARLFPHMTVRQNLFYGGDFDADRLIERLGLEHLLDRYPSGLSGGEKQRVALGRALMSGPEVLLMDEPLAALDAQRKSEILPYLEALRDSTNIPIFYVSHDFDEVARLATSLVVLDAGRVVASGPLGEVIASPAVVPAVGARLAGAAINAVVRGRLLDDQMTEVAFSGGRLLLQGQLGDLGNTIRLRIAASDVILSVQRPEGLSALNIIPVKISAITPLNAGSVGVSLLAGHDTLLAQLTQRSVNRLALRVGQDVFAIIKANAVAT